MLEVLKTLGPAGAIVIGMVWLQKQQQAMLVSMLQLMKPQALIAEVGSLSKKVARLREDVGWIRGKLDIDPPDRADRVSVPAE